MSTRFRVAALGLVTVLAVALAVAIVISSSGGSPKASVPNGGFDGATLPPGVHARDFTLSDQHGRDVSLSADRGKVVVLAFLSSGCRTCVLVAQQVRGALDELGAAPGVRTIFVSTDPQTDTPARVSRFLEETSLSGRVEYLTGASGQLRGVWRAYGISPAHAGSAAAEAGVTVLLIDRQGIERVGFGLEQIAPESLAHDIRMLRAG